MAQFVIETSSLAEAIKWIQEHDPEYFNRYYGDCFLICDQPAMWQHIVANPRKVKSTLLDKDILGFHILAEVKNKDVWNQDTLTHWFNRTLAKLQLPIEREFVEETLTQLVDWGMLRIEENGVFHITQLGLVSATLYYLPRDVRHWASGFDVLDKNELWTSDLAFSYVLGTTPSIDLNYVPRAEQDEVKYFTDAVTKVMPEGTSIRQSMMATAVHNWLSQAEKSVYIRNFQTDADRMTQAFVWIAGIKHWSAGGTWTAFPIRMRYGVGPEMVELCMLPGIGAARAKKLHAQGIRSLDSLISNAKMVNKLVGNAIATKAIAAAKNELRKRQTDDS